MDTSDAVPGLTSKPAWLDGPLTAFDIETTGVHPKTDRIVTAVVVHWDPQGAVKTREWVADPGVEIPESAAAIHGITTAHAREAGVKAPVVVRGIVEELSRLTADGTPLVVFNAPFDLTMLSAEAERYDIEFKVPSRVIDPSVLDKHLDRYRKGLRRLQPTCEHYGVELTAEDAHDAREDALGAMRLAWVLGSRGRVIRRARSDAEAHELAELEEEWARVRQDLDALHAAQARWYRASMVGLREHFLEKGKRSEAAEVTYDWPSTP